MIFFKSDLDTLAKIKLEALNNFRMGYICRSLYKLAYTPHSHDFDLLTMHEYSESPDEFKIQMELVACYLESEYAE